MTRFDRDDLPSDLSDVERMLRAERPVAGEGSMDRMRPRTQAAARKSPSRAPRRTLAVSMATVCAMVALTGGTAAAMFGSVPLLHKSSHKAAAAMSTKRVAGSSSSASAAAKLSGLNSISALVSKGSTTKPTTGAGKAGSKANVTPTIAFPPALFPNAGNIQYLLKQLVCRILRRVGLNGFANALGCP